MMNKAVWFKGGNYLWSPDRDNTVYLRKSKFGWTVEVVLSGKEEIHDFPTFKEAYRFGKKSIPGYAQIEIDVEEFRKINPRNVVGIPTRTEVLAGPVIFRNKKWQFVMVWATMTGYVIVKDGKTFWAKTWKYAVWLMRGNK